MMALFKSVSALVLLCGCQLALTIMSSKALAQDSPSRLPDAPQPQNQPTQANPDQNGQPPKPSKNHIFWVIPNYRADENTAEIKPLTPKAKFKIAFDDSFDPSAFLVAGVLAGLADAQNSYREYGDGAESLGKYFAASFADQAIGNMMTEAVFPTALHQDPRYFVKGRGGFWKRTGYAISREVITRGDDGRSQFNTSELAGNAVAAGISNAYTPASERSLGNTSSKYGTQIGLDTFFNVLKEFWPDVRDKLFHQ
ncbi:MAG TPA: hypothetical protein VNZ03_01665 [Terriglobales bacterium]|jgi:hypothetical protein|nr:hypothetical protein [Terriglobales bacterium]